jgi:hypothetical protein
VDALIARAAQEEQRRFFILIRRKIAHNCNLSETELSQFEAINQYFYEFMARRNAP